MLPKELIEPNAEGDKVKQCNKEQDPIGNLHCTDHLHDWRIWPIAIPRCKT